jgi:trimethylamine--corrinoid protein Co-methyltransferase
MNARRDPAAQAAAGARVLSLWHGATLGVLPEPDLERIRAAVLTVLEDPGVAIAGPLAGRLGAAGARVDDRVHLPAALVEESLGRIPPGFVLAARDPACDLHVGAREGWLGAGGRAERVVDLRTDDRRPPLLEDVGTFARLADAQPQIAIVGPPPSATDIPEGARPLLELHALLEGTSKHVQVEAPADAAGARALLAIAAAVAGGGTTLAERPIVSAVVPVASPLALDGDALEAAVALASAGVPCGFIVAPVAGLSAPATVPGALVTAAASALAGVVALQLLAPGAPTFLGSAAMTVAAGAAPRPGGAQGPLFQMAWTQIARDLGLPSRIDTIATGSKSSDWQAGMEGGLSSVASWMTAPDVLGGAGLRDGGRIFSPVAMLLDAELFDLVRRIPLGFAVDEDTLALEVIEKVGPGDHFLGEPHTLRHMREMWTARFMDTETWEAWEEAGRPQPPERAHARALETLETHETLPLDPAAEARIREVIAEHERG